MDGKISVVINTFNEAEVVERLIKSVKWADEILVCDMNSDDDTALVAKKAGAKVIFIKRQPFVELARNLSISKAKNEWILVLDPDEEVSESLADKLQEIAKTNGVTTVVEIPRKNIIFNKWVKASMWWPDYNIRFFKRDAVKWSNKIHIKPETIGQGLKLPEEERFAITHYHYNSIDQFLSRLNRYTTIQAKELKESGYSFTWKDLVRKPLSEFLGRFFANRGFEDGLHGLVLSMLQAFSFLIVYLKVWEMEEFKDQKIELNDLKVESDEAGKELKYWFKYGNLSKNPLKRFLQRAKNRVTS
jgi:glycosyltransferase involved in cell wall biosynthesis